VFPDFAYLLAGGPWLAASTVCYLFGEEPDTHPAGRGARWMNF